MKNILLFSVVLMLFSCKDEPKSELTNASGYLAYHKNCKGEKKNKLTKVSMQIILRDSSLNPLDTIKIPSQSFNDSFRISTPKKGVRYWSINNIFDSAAPYYSFFCPLGCRGDMDFDTLQYCVSVFYINGELLGTSIKEKNIPIETPIVFNIFCDCIGTGQERYIPKLLKDHHNE